MSAQFLAEFGLNSPPLAVGSEAPDFTLARGDGSSVSLSDLRGQPAILAFYPSQWDPTRAQQLAHYNALVRQVPGIDAELLGISTDGMWCQLAFNDDEMRVPVLADLDPLGAVAERYGVSGEQAVFVLDAHGVVRWRHLGALGALPHGGDLVRALSQLATGSAGADDGMRVDMNDVMGIRATELPSAFVATRRDFVVTALAAALTMTVLPRLSRAQQVADAVAAPERANVAAMPVTLNVNGHTLTLSLEPRVTLLDALREYAGLTGSKKGCDHGQCGACTVHVNGRRVLSCLSFAAMHQHDEITTVEGLAQGDTLHPMQAAFIEHDGFQCGYCTPGQLMSATALLKEPCGKDDADVRECMSGNICRCGAYPGIVAAVQSVRARS